MPNKQPAVIPVFFATEMWERFGFYIIQGLLVLYMTSHVFGFSDDKSYSILGAFSAIAYITPIFGGYVASKILDFEHAVTLGGILLAVGYAILALPEKSLFFWALAIISIGNGFFKPNISSYLGDFYKTNDPYREKGYTIFYVGINVGILLATSTSGYLVRYFGWHTPFLLACFGLLIGTVTFIFGLRFLKTTDNFNRVKKSIASKKTLSIVLVYLAAVAGIGLSHEIIQHRSLANQLMLWGGAAVYVGLGIYAFRYNKTVRNKWLVCIILTAISIVFWAIFFQMFFSINLFIERAVDRHFFNFILPTPLFLSLESICIILFGPLLASVWHKLAAKNKNPSIPTKFTWAMFMLCVAFLIAYAGTKITHTNGQTDKIFIILTYFFITMGELLLSPVGLAMVTMLAPQEMVGLMMGVWFVSLGLGSKLAGVIAQYAAIPHQLHALSHIDYIYGKAFLGYAILSLACALICVIILPFLKKLLGAN